MYKLLIGVWDNPRAYRCMSSVYASDLLENGGQGGGGGDLSNWYTNCSLLILSLLDE